MSFPPKVAEKALLDSKRSCCICHKFCGVKIELHHIVQVSEGGENTYDNCIPLCLDCHAEVKAYNDKHPKGKKYRESELRQHRDRWYKKVRDSIPHQIDGVKEVSNFPNLAHEIWPLITENHRAFKSYGPRSGAADAAPVRWDLSLWEEAKTDIILPNNQKIEELIKSNWEQIPPKYQPAFEKMLTHIYAFEKHCENSTIDYTEHQFPQEFTSIIDETCVREANRGIDIEKIENWLEAKFETVGLPVTQAYLAGSILRGTFEDSDVDIFLLLSDTNPDEIKTSSQNLQQIKTLFLLEFKCPLHCAVFSKSETEAFHEFINNLTRKRQLIT
jgi:predicted nucleotidyltransferase